MFFSWLGRGVQNTLEKRRKQKKTLKNKEYKEIEI